MANVLNVLFVLLGLLKIEQGCKPMICINDKAKKERTSDVSQMSFLSFIKDAKGQKRHKGQVETNKNRFMWLDDEQTTIVKNHTQNTGRTRTLQQVLLCDCLADIHTICALRKLDRLHPNYKQHKEELKRKLQCWAPSCLFANRSKENPVITKRTSLLQLDFDCEALKDFDLDEVKQALFSLPFTAFCSLSCSGDGCYALIKIAEPEKLDLYCEHLFTVLIEDYGIKPDVGKGTNPLHLRYASYDSNMLIRKDCDVLSLTSFRSRAPLIIPVKTKHYITTGEDERSQVEQLINCLHTSHSDITSSYEEWLQVGFALSTAFGESGRRYYHDISSLNGGYKPNECDKQYTNCLRGKRTGITLRTLFHLAKSAGIIISKQSSYNLATA